MLDYEQVNPSNSIMTQGISKKPLTFHGLAGLDTAITQRAVPLQ